MARDGDKKKRGARRIPPTGLDAPVPPTSVDPPSSPREVGAQIPGTRLDGAEETVDGSIFRFDLPPKLRDSHELIGSLHAGETRAVGGEATLALVRNRASGEREVYKVYLTALARDEEVWERLAKANREDIYGHVVDILDYGTSGGVRWELMEYCELGSLADLIDKEGPRMSPERIREITTEITAALEFLHGLRIPHADLKPQNILVRSLDPFDLVLTDFGLSRALNQSKEVRSMIGLSFQYAPPQAFMRKRSVGKDGGSSNRGLVSVAYDWWALGMIAGEMALGRHPLAFEDGELPDDLVAADEIVSRSIDFSAIEDGRLRSLCEGLTRRDDRKGHRWGLTEVRGWLAGENPKVVEQDSEQQAPRSVASPFPFQDPETKATRAYTDPIELAAAMALNWGAACEILGGTSARRAEQRAFRSFLQSLHLNDAVQILAEQGDDEYRLTQLLVELDPTIAPTFRGYALDGEGLLGLARSEEDAEKGALAAIYSERILINYSRSSAHAHLADLDASWHQEMEAFDDLVSRAGDAIDGAERASATKDALATILIALLDPSARDELHQRAATAASDEGARRQPWFAELANQQAAST